MAETEIITPGEKKNSKIQKIVFENGAWYMHVMIIGKHYHMVNETESSFTFDLCQIRRTLSE